MYAPNGLKTLIHLNPSSRLYTTKLYQGKTFIPILKQTSTHWPLFTSALFQNERGLKKLISKSYRDCSFSSLIM